MYLFGRMTRSVCIRLMCMKIRGGKNTPEEVTGTVALRSVTASSEEERRDLRKFLQTLAS